jgi:hypothetical protein
MVTSGHHWSVKFLNAPLPAMVLALLLHQALRAAAPACNAALWCCSRAFGSSKPQLQQQQEVAEPLTGLAFDEVYVEHGGPYSGSSSRGSEQTAQVGIGNALSNTSR